MATLKNWQSYKLIVNMSHHLHLKKRNLTSIYFYKNKPRRPYS